MSPQVQLVVEDAPLQVQLPFMHVPGHERPQPLQFLASVFTLVSHPLAGFPSQLPQPVLQLTMVQRPEEHIAEAFMRLHRLLQSPQWFGSDLVSTHVPPQFACPDGQLHEVPEQTPPDGQLAHLPPQHRSPVRQLIPHIPQWLVLLRVSTHVPLQRVHPSGQPASPPSTSVEPSPSTGASIACGPSRPASTCVGASMTSGRSTNASSTSTSCPVSNGVDVSTVSTPWVCSSKRSWLLSKYAELSELDSMAPSRFDERCWSAQPASDNRQHKSAAFHRNHLMESFRVSVFIPAA